MATHSSEESDLNDEVCKVCEEENTRVLLLCDGCPAAFHLKCLNPPLARTPKGNEWYCPDCFSTRKKLLDENHSNQFSSIVKKDEKDINSIMEESAEEIQVKNKIKSKSKATTIPTTTRSTSIKKKKRNLDEMIQVKKNKRVKHTKKEVITILSSSSSDSDAKDSEDEEDEKDNLPLASLQVKIKTKTKRTKPKAKKAEEKSISAGGREQLKCGAKAAVLRKKKKPAGDEEEKDDEDDSDFLPGEGTSEDDDDFVNETIVPRPSIANRKRVISVAGLRTSSLSRNPTQSDTDSLTLEQPEVVELDNEDEDEEEERQLANGPIYFVEYAPNGRAKCKSCEEKLSAQTLRIGVKVKHSLFGINTYYKCFTCTQICLPVSENKKIVKDQTYEETKSKHLQENDDEPIRGFRRLTPIDQAKLMAYMKENTEKSVDDERIGINDSHYQRKAHMPEKEPSKKLIATLLPYQREALAWMCTQEKSIYGGGILADEMGMGKTLQAISVIVEKKRLTEKNPNTNLPHGGTLVVCPLVAVTQWKNEIEKFVEPGFLSIYIHHGSKRIICMETIAKYDIVITTYSILETEIRQSLMAKKIACQFCKKKFLPEKLIFHNKYFCGPNAQKTSKQKKQQTKAKTKTKTKAKVNVFVSKESEASDTSEEEEEEKEEEEEAKQAEKKKNTVATKNTQAKTKTTTTPLHLIFWTRIILDEAHYIKDRRSNTARGVFELKSQYKWCLTGTPLQNRIGELFSLIRFLQIKKYAYYHCRKCPCQILDFNFPEGKCLYCDHGSISHFSYFTKKIVQPIQGYGYVAEGKIAMIRLQNEVLQHILLRRTKQGRADDLCLPPKLIRIRKDQLDERENDFYQAIYTQSQAQFNTYVSSGTLLNNYAHIFDLLIRLRQAVDHPYLVIYSKSNPALQVPLLTTTNVDAHTQQQQRPVMDQKPFLTFCKSEEFENEEGKECGICHEDVEDAILAKCTHIFCRVCVEEYMESLPMEADATCPVCEKPLTIDLTTTKCSSNSNSNSNSNSKAEAEAESELDRILETQWTTQQIQTKKKILSRYHKHSILHRLSDLQSFQTSTKIEALMQELEHLKIRDPCGKAIVFSQFVNMLDIIQHRLTLGGIKCVKLSGNMSMDVRDQTLKAFREDSSITVFLISLKAGGVALNLTVASHIFLMDPWWNPAAENQAIDRVHRLGQFKPVQATRFIIAGTVEERILKLQEKKQLVFEGTVGANVSALTRLTEEDLRFLFNK